MPDPKSDLRDLAADDQVAGTFQLIQFHQRQTPQGAPYLLGEVRSHGGSLGFVCWNSDLARQEGLSGTGVVHLEGKVEAYKGRLQLVVHAMRPMPAGAAAEVFQAPDGIDLEGLQKDLRRLIQAINDHFLRRLLSSLLLDGPVATAFAQAPAGIAMHHSYRGGLMEHSVRMALCAEDMACRHAGRVDRDLLVAGALLHDLGKTEELTWEGALAYTTRGNLVGHLVIGCIQIEQAIARLPGFPTRLRDKLLHLVASHHGTAEQGAVRLPVTAEALVLHYLDAMDANLDAFRRSVRETTSTDPDWTETARMFGRRLYRGP